MKKILVLTLVLGFSLVASGCGHRPKEDKRTIAQISAALPDEGYFLCRQDFSYVYNAQGSTVHEFIARAGENRRNQLMAIFNECTGPNSSIAARQACAHPEALQQIPCAHEAAIASKTRVEPTSAGVCTLRYAYYYEGRQLSTFQGTIVSNVYTSGSNLINHVRSVVEQCMQKQGSELDGCTRALMDAQLSCETR